jgi:replicative DNA helicase Mcm
MFHFCLKLVGYDHETQQFDIDRISTGVSHTQRDRVMIITETLKELEKDMSKEDNQYKGVPVSDLIIKLTEKGISESDAELLLKKMSNAGECYSPVLGFIKLMPN